MRTIVMTRDDYNCLINCGKHHSAWWNLFSINNLTYLKQLAIYVDAEDNYEVVKLEIE